MFANPFGGKLLAKDHPFWPLLQEAVRLPRQFVQVDPQLTNAVGRKLLIELAYIQGPKWPGAIIDKVGSTLCAAVYDLTALCAIEISRYIFSRSSIFPWLGASEDEKNNRLPSNYPLGLGSLHCGTNEYRDISLAITPRCPIRHLAADCFAIEMINYIWFHEIAHGAEGHVDLLKRNLSLGHEIAVSGVSKIGNVNRQMMEMEADRIALELVFDPGTFEQRALKRQMGLQWLSLDQCGAVVLLAILMTSFLWCQVDRLLRRKNIEEFNYGSYPISSFRLWDQMILVLAMTQTEHKRFGELKGAADSTIQTIVALAEIDSQFRILTWLFTEGKSVAGFKEYRRELYERATLSEDLASYRYR